MGNIGKQCVERTTVDQCKTHQSKNTILCENIHLKQDKRTKVIMFHAEQERPLCRLERDLGGPEEDELCLIRAG